MNVNAEVNANAGGSAIALPGLCLDELKIGLLLVSKISEKLYSLQEK